MLAAWAVNTVVYTVPFAAVIAALASRMSERAAVLGPRGMAAVAMLILSTLAMGLWRFYDGAPMQTEIWQKGLFLDALLYLLVLYGIFTIGARALAGFLAVAGICYFVGLNSEDMGLKQIAEAIQLCLVAFLAISCFRTTPTGDLAALVLWGGLGAAEAFSAVLNIDCQFFHGMYGMRNEGSACAQVYGFDITLLAIYVPAALFAWVIYRCFWPRPG